MGSEESTVQSAPKRGSVLVVLSVLGQPRHAKRIEMLKQTGFDVTAVAFDRNFHRGRLPDCPVEILGTVYEARYFQRMILLLRSIFKLRRALRFKDAIYVFGADMALLAWIARGLRSTPIVIEVGDIRDIQLDQGWRGRVFRHLDRFIMKRCAMIVSTTSKFVEEYYRKWLGILTLAVIIENKVEPGLGIGIRALPAISSAIPNDSQPIRIGYFGLLGCPWAVETLDQLVRRFPQKFQVVLAGFPWPSADLSRIRSNTAAVSFLGQYKSPADLPRLYESVDIVWVCYPPIGPNDWNLRWARPNRFYESCFFHKPVISRDGSCDAVDVKKFDLGLVIKAVTVDDAVDALQGITWEMIARWRDNSSQLPRQIFEYTTEYSDLAIALSGLMSNQHDRSI